MTGTGKGTRVYILQLVEQLGLALIVIATLVAVGEEVAKIRGTQRVCERREVGWHAASGAHH